MLCDTLMQEGIVEHIGQTAVCKILRENRYQKKENDANENRVPDGKDK